MRLDPEDLVEEQLAFYRADAAGYEAWCTEVFEHGRGGPKGAAVRRDEARVREALGRFAARGRVLELAAGTGRYTPALLASAEHVTALDASPEALAIARSKLAPALEAGRLELVEADLFGWSPRHRYDCVFFAFWLSHVPPGRLEAFWRRVREALAPQGRVFLVDAAVGPRLPGPTAAGQPTYRELDHAEPHVSVRELAGRRYHVVRVLREPQQLEERLAKLGWSAAIERGELTLWGCAKPQGRLPPRSRSACGGSGPRTRGAD